VNLVVGFFRFWYDFVVGDSVLLAIGAVVTLTIGAALVWMGWRPAAELVLPAAVIVTLGVSLPRRAP
jgi:hypothetical protein